MASISSKGHSVKLESFFSESTCENISNAEETEHMEVGITGRILKMNNVRIMGKINFIKIDATILQDHANDDNDA